MIKDATFVSVWDGCVEIATSCKVDTKTKEVFCIESVDVEGIDVLDEEYVLIDGVKHSVRDVENDCWYFYE